MPTHEEDDRRRVRLVSRRAVLAGAAGVLAFDRLSSPILAGSSPDALPVFRFAHLADIHVQPELRAAEGFRKCMAAVHALKPRPSFILMGGDLVYDVLEVDSARARKVFSLYQAICRDSDIPVYHCLGNHDIFGWGSRGKVAASDPHYGRGMALDQLGLARSNYSFDHGGWHFVVVDDILPDPETVYHGGLDEPTLAWLDDDLGRAADRPKVVCLHIPAVSVAAWRGYDAGDAAELALSRRMVCKNPGAGIALMKKHRVQLVLAGHLHQNEIIRLDHTTHITEAAVCGAWWKGPHHGFAEGFGVIDVYADGTFGHHYHPYRWRAAATQPA